VRERRDLVGQLADVLCSADGVQPVPGAQLRDHGEHVHRLAARVEREQHLPEQRVARVVEVPRSQDRRDPRDDPLLPFAVEQRSREHGALGLQVGERLCAPRDLSHAVALPS
jgi:hypothetical protein